MISTLDHTADWNALSEAEQLRQWSRFTMDLDAGEAAFHRFYLVLMPMWDRGDVPTGIDRGRFARRIIEAAEDAAWELGRPPVADGWMDDSVRQANPATAADYGDPAF
jgi:hypothetical protein